MYFWETWHQNILSFAIQFIVIGNIIYASTHRHMNATPLNNFKSSTTLKVLHSQWSDDLELSWGVWRGDHSGPCQSCWPLSPRPGARSRTRAESRSREPPGICWHTCTWHLPLKPSNRQSSSRASKYNFRVFINVTQILVTRWWWGRAGRRECYTSGWGDHPETRTRGAGRCTARRGSLAMGDIVKCIKRWQYCVYQLHWGSRRWTRCQSRGTHCWPRTWTLRPCPVWRGSVWPGRTRWQISEQITSSGSRNYTQNHFQGLHSASGMKSW